MKKRVVITIDGLAGSGKSTLAKMLATELGFEHLNSGLLYRAVGWLSLKENCTPELAAGLVETHKIELISSEAVLIDSLVRAKELATSEVGNLASLVASRPEVRAALLSAQQNACPGKNIVAEGRDMGTVVFPDAAMKFFVSVSETTRGVRRLQQLYPTLVPGSAEYAQKRTEITTAIRERDVRDKSRAVAPTVAAIDAVQIDNSEAKPEAAVKKMVEMIRQKGLLR